MIAQFLVAIQLINFSVIRADIGQCAGVVVSSAFVSS